MIRVVLPTQLKALTELQGEAQLQVDGPVTQASVLEALEVRYPMLRGTLRDQLTHKRRPFVRCFAGQQDVSHQLPEQPLPQAIVSGRRAVPGRRRRGRRLDSPVIHLLGAVCLVHRGTGDTKVLLDGIVSDAQLLGWSA